MDDFDFDYMAKALATPATRRASLGLIAAGLLGLTSVYRGRNGEEAQASQTVQVAGSYLHVGRTLLLRHV